jgi:hypothetical protein
MKTNFFQKTLATIAVAGILLSARVTVAQDSSATDNSPVPQLAYGVPQILQLAQAKVGDDTIIAYIKNSGNSYGLNADQIIYLRQQGLSSAVVTAMLSQPKPGVLAAASATAVPQTTVTSAQSPVTYVQTVPATTYYYSEPAAYTYYSYQPAFYPYYYGWYPGVSFSIGWGGRWGGWHGGGFRGGGFHGGWHR